MEPDTSDELSESPTDSSPAAEPPRLGILHLMVLTTCVAFYQGTMQGLQRVFGSEALQINEGTSAAVHGIAAGAALAGLVLFVARRRRGMPFPIHPGEVLIVMQGVAAVATLVWFTTYVLLVQASIVGPPRGHVIEINVVILGGLVGICLTHVALWIWAFVRLKIPRWRFFLLSIPVCYVLVLMLLGFAERRIGSRVSELYLFVVPVLISVVLGIVVLRDHLMGLRYPWTHWFGVAVYFGRAAAMIISGMIWWLSQP